MNAPVAAALWITLLAAVWGVVTSLRICAWLGSRRQEVDFLLLRLKLFEYVGR